jgi:hypothetical protein
MPRNPANPRYAQRFRCGKCGAPGRWGEACIMCGATYTEGEVRAGEAVGAHYYDLPFKLRVNHGSTCTAEGEPHRCHCGGGVTHPCNCYDSPPTLICHICGFCDCEHEETA